MLYFFLDDSGTDDRSPVITMAGYVASSEHWAIFDKRARKLYERYGINVLHALDFHGTKGEFARWEGDKKMSFVRELFSLAKHSVMLGVSVTVQKEGYKAAGKRTGFNKNISPYGMCFSIIAEFIHQDRDVAAAAHRGISFRVEKGNKNNPDVNQRFEHFAEHEQLVDVLRTMRFVDKHHSTANQLADFLAYYSRRHSEKCEREQDVRAKHEEPLATMLQLVRHRGILANDFFGKRPGHEDLPGV